MLPVFFLFILNIDVLNAQNKKTVNKQSSAARSTVDPQIFGAWDVWISGAVTYTATETAVYRNYSHGSAMNCLVIDKGGAYKWGEKSGKLAEVRPWHAQEGRKYYRISDLKGNEYDFWYDRSKDKLIVLFGEVGGHAATGTRLDRAKQMAASKTPVTTSQAPTNLKKDSNGQNKFSVGQKVTIEWKGQWYKGTVLELKDGKYKVNYDGWGTLYDEWVEPARIKALK